jgi:predicted helicase
MMVANKQINKLIELFERAKYKGLFEDFVKRLSNNLNNANLTKESVIEMLFQLKITEPIFNLLFKDYEFAKNNPLSIVISTFLSEIEKIMAYESKDLKAFYDNIELFGLSAKNSRDRQAMIVELYNSFFKKAFPDKTKNLGIVYTPIEIVDFIIKSADDILKAEFGMNLTDEGVNIIDPFTGTGTFIARLLNSGLIRDVDLERKYTKELYANEIVLLTYYIASVNIGNEYHLKTSSQQYKEFQGIHLTDTYEMGECTDMTICQSINTIRRVMQRKKAITVIIGNPPYAIHGNKGEFSKSKRYARLDQSLKSYYVECSNSKNTKSLYDSYIRAFRWASDNIGMNDGIIAFVSSGSWLKASCCDGLRKSFTKEFCKIFVYNLRGDMHTRGNAPWKEGENVFSINLKQPVTITILVKRKNFDGMTQIYYRDIGDYLKAREKLKALEEARSFLCDTMPKMTILNPNEYGDWLKERSVVFDEFYPLASKNPTTYFEDSNSVFSAFGLGMGTNRDHWVVSYSKRTLEIKAQRIISYYNEQVDLGVIDKKDKNINWDDVLIRYAKQKKKVLYDASNIRYYSYRPFCKKVLYFSTVFNHRTTMFNSLFPTPNAKNQVISLSGIASKNNFSVYISDKIVDLNFLETTRCFPLYYYTNNETIDSKTQAGDVSREEDDHKNQIKRVHGISDYFANLVKTKYNENISKDDIFYYVYGILHNKSYAAIFKDDLQIALPRIPLVDSLFDFKTYVKAGRKLAWLHLNYESIQPLDTLKVKGGLSNLKVTQMRFSLKPGTKVKDKSTIVYNKFLKITNIPDMAYDYILSGRSAIGHVMEHYQIKTDKVSDVCQDPNEWCDEINNPRYILELLLSVITLSVKTLKIVDSLPELDLKDKKGFPKPT